MRSVIRGWFPALLLSACQINTILKLGGGAVFPSKGDAMMNRLNQACAPRAIVLVSLRHRVHAQEACDEHRKEKLSPHRFEDN